MKNRRRLANYVIDPYLQFRFAGYTILLAVVFATAFGFFSYLYLGRVVATVADNGEMPGVVRSYLEDSLRGYLVWTLVLLGIYTLLLFLYTLLHTHRIAGASYAISKFVRTKLAEGDYDGKVILRKHDYLSGVADDVNALAEKLRRDREPSGSQTSEGAR